MTSLPNRKVSFGSQFGDFGPRLGGPLAFGSVARQHVMMGRSMAGKAELGKTLPPCTVHEGGWGGTPRSSLKGSLTS